MLRQASLTIRPTAVLDGVEGGGMKNETLSAWLSVGIPRGFATLCHTFYGLFLERGFGAAKKYVAIKW